MNPLDSKMKTDHSRTYLFILKKMLSSSSKMAEILA